MTNHTLIATTSPMDMIDRTGYHLSSTAIRRFVAQHQIVTESARTAFPSVVGYIVGREFRGSWWALPDSSAIYNALQRLRDDDSLAVCRLVKGKITYVDQDSWIDLAALEKSLPAGSLDRIVETHSATGSHAVRSVPPKVWLSSEARARAASLAKPTAVLRLEARLPGIARRLGLSGAPH